MWMRNPLERAVLAICLLAVVSLAACKVNLTATSAGRPCVTDADCGSSVICQSGVCQAALDRLTPDGGLTPAGGLTPGTPDSGSQPLPTSAYYVSASNGNDSADGLTPASAWKSLARVSNLVLQPSTVVYLSAGDVWMEGFAPAGGGSALQPVIVDVYPAGGAPAVLNGSNGDAGVVGLMLLKFNHVSVRNLSLLNWATAVYVAGSSDVELAGVTMADAGYGLEVDNGLPSDQLTVRQSSILASAVNGLVTHPSASNVLVEDTVVDGAGNSCITDQSDSSHYTRITVRNCSLIPGSKTDAVRLSGAQTLIDNATVQGATYACIELAGVKVGKALSNQASGCKYGVLVSGTLDSGVVDVQRNSVWNSGWGIIVAVLTRGTVRVYNNALLGGYLDGGLTTTGMYLGGFDMDVANNLVNGIWVNSLSIQGPEVTSTAFHFHEDYNAFWQDGGTLNVFFGTTNESYLTYQGQTGQGAHSFTGGDPKLTSTNARGPNFHLQASSPLIDLGTSTPGPFQYNPGCDGGLSNYCGAAPEPGVFEFLP